MRIDEYETWQTWRWTYHSLSESISSTPKVGLDFLSFAAVVPFLSRRIDGASEETSRHFAGNVPHLVVALGLSLSLSLPPKRGRQTRQINTTREIARTGFSTGRDSALNGPFTNFDVSTYVSFQTFYEVVNRAGFPPLKLFRATMTSCCEFSL